MFDVPDGCEKGRFWNGPSYEYGKIPRPMFTEEKKCLYTKKQTRGRVAVAAPKPRHVVTGRLGLVLLAGPGLRQGQP